MIPFIFILLFFSGFVSLAGADNNLWSIHGGNKLAPEGILTISKATVKMGDVSEVVLKSDGTFELSVNDISSNHSLSTEQYDIVVIASPMIKNSKNIKFTNFRKDFTEFQSIFHRTVSTFVQGKLNSSAFNENNIPGEILTFKDSLIFNSLSKVTPVSDVQHKDKKNVYKVFSQKPLTDEKINFLFRDVDAVKVKDWLAYPHYKPPENLPPFMLYPGLYYTNAIELAASAMEMSAIAGKNVALLAYNAWHNIKHKIDHHNKLNKDEL